MRTGAVAAEMHIPETGFAIGITVMERETVKQYTRRNTEPPPVRPR
jgi:hypothetical protein